MNQTPQLNRSLSLGLLTLVVLADVNAALLRVKQTQSRGPDGTFRVPAIVPVPGILSIIGIGVFALGYSPTGLPPLVFPRPAFPGQ